MTDWYETMEDNVKWVVKTAKSVEELAELSEGLENDGWLVRTISVEQLSILASKKLERLDD
jgi:hypothetical protein|tara:strand:- start:493 stop:675 length:183 start_codon:yes stop_codon:yes gene_type:complete